MNKLIVLTVILSALLLVGCQSSGPTGYAGYGGYQGGYQGQGQVPAQGGYVGAGCGVSSQVAYDATPAVVPAAIEA